MDLRQLEYFVAVAETGSFTRAAQRVHITQSGVSAQIKALEHELGAELFIRSGRTARLTDAGSVALRHARAALDSTLDLRDAIDEVKGLIRGRLTIGMVIGCEVAPLFDALAAFHAEHPGIELELAEANSDQLVAGVRTGSLDVALAGLAGVPPEHLATRVLIRERLVALVPPTSDLAGSPGVPISLLSAYPVICLPVGTGIRDALDRSTPGRSAVALVATSPDTVAGLTRRGLGVAVLSESMAAAHPDLTAVPIDGADVPALLALVWQERPNPALTAFLKHFP
ncbi:LysR family transcriptional regulator [Actinoplanes sp. SE50]|uniref:LysR family transcriptional regulator n=1 Tax=unclassified Actinoplanes TaxID=2626549 RepID=UPI00023ECDDF|nr:MULTISPECIES: LysR family transcriptional regulator [unclassified Actinoplanes]AEV81578.1 putative RuBisCO transcriptional regulator [Actinoplanes sp. SE50/110]ATO79979.1 LysR family transcriptional regulator [Actinoplanes sp. SE50]SLL97382.1 LysR family transcriptional regulator [Actinoplanes sp. SE50/110]